MIHVLAIITAKTGMRDAILKEFRANMPAVHAEKGCMRFTDRRPTPRGWVGFRPNSATTRLLSSRNGKVPTH